MQVLVIPDPTTPGKAVVVAEDGVRTQTELVSDVDGVMRIRLTREDGTVTESNVRRVECPK